MKARKFLDALLSDGVHVCVSHGKVELSGPEDCVSEAKEVMETVPYLEEEMLFMLSPSFEDMKAWLGSHGESIREECQARVERLKKAGISNAESVGLSTTYHDHNSTLPGRLRPMVIRNA